MSKLRDGSGLFTTLFLFGLVVVAFGHCAYRVYVLYGARL